jgi:hypothetical protein
MASRRLDRVDSAALLRAIGEVRAEVDALRVALSTPTLPPEVVDALARYAERARVVAYLRDRGLVEAAADIASDLHMGGSSRGNGMESKGEP